MVRSKSVGLGISRKKFDRTFCYISDQSNQQATWIRNNWSSVFVRQKSERLRSESTDSDGKTPISKQIRSEDSSRESNRSLSFRTLVLPNKPPLYIYSGYIITFVDGVVVMGSSAAYNGICKDVDAATTVQFPILPAHPNSTLACLKYNYWPMRNVKIGDKERNFSV